MRNIPMRYLKKAGPAKSGKLFMANHVEAKALAAIGHARRVSAEPDRAVMPLVQPAADIVSPPDLAQVATSISTPGPVGPVIADTVRALAEQHQIDITTLKGSGQNGRILKADVEAAIAAAKVTD